MESIHRSFLLLRPGDAPGISPKSRAMLKLRDTPAGLSIHLTASGLPGGPYELHLFLADGAPVLAGTLDDDGASQQVLPGIRSGGITGAAIIHRDTLSFALKSDGLNWPEISARFKLAKMEQLIRRHSAAAAREDPPAPLPLPDETLPMQNHNGQPPVLPDETKNALARPEPPDCDACPHAIRQERVNPFPSVFPKSDWVKISYPGPTGWWHYITGNIYSGKDAVAKAVGVPGEYGMTPPVWLEGFGTYLRCVTPDAHGYWLMFQDSQTGEVLDLGLSQRDA
jgi:hypothetical protein